MWAVQSVKAFADAYFAALQINPNYAHPHKWPKPNEVVARKHDPATTT
jgi:hypothetical protein